MATVEVHVLSFLETTFIITSSKKIASPLNLNKRLSKVLQKRRLGSSRCAKRKTKQLASSQLLNGLDHARSLCLSLERSAILPTWAIAELYSYQGAAKMLWL